MVTIIKILFLLANKFVFSLIYLIFNMATLQKQHQQQQNFAYDENDVMRYDADLYHQKYGNKWKRFASSIRDVKQEDGSIIREYLIEDPSLLEELSDDDFDSEYFKQEMDQEVEKIHQQMSKNLEYFYSTKLVGSFLIV